MDNYYKKNKGSILVVKETNKQPPAEQNSGWFARFLATVEWLGNLLPHPVTLFAGLALFIVVLSGILGYFDVAVADPRPLDAKGRDPDGMIEVISLMRESAHNSLSTFPLHF